MASPASVGVGGNSNNLLKTIFQDKPPAWTALEKSAFLAEVKKDTEYGGDENATVVVSIAAGAGVSSNFVTAKANISATQERKFLLGFNKLYALTAVNGDAIARSRSDKMAIARILKHNIERTTWKFNQALSAQMWSIGGGALTRLPSDVTLTGATVTCSPISDASYFEKGDKIEFASDDGTGSNPAGTRDSGETLTVSSVNYQTGVVTFSANLNTIDGIAASDYCFRAGTYGPDGSRAFNGVRAWIPQTAPSSGESFKNVDRSVCVNRLAGLRIDGTTGRKHDTLRDAAAEFAQTGAGGGKLRLYTNPRDFSDMLGEVDAYSMIRLPDQHPKMGHRGLSVYTPAGEVICVSEPHVPQGAAWLLNLDTWRLRTAGGCPQYLDYDNLGKLMRAESDDVVVCRMGTYGELECNNPGENMAITW